MKRTIAVFGCLLLWSAARVEPIRAQAAQEDSVRVDFQDAQLSVVLSVLAEAGNLNVVYTGLPFTLVTLRMNQPVARSQILPLLRSIASSNGLTVIEDGPLLRIEAAEPAVAAPQPEIQPQESQEAAGPPVRLFVYPLKHARAEALAATLGEMFTYGAGAGGGPERPLSLSEQLGEFRMPPIEEQQQAEPDVALQQLTQIGLPGQLSSEVTIVPEASTNFLLIRATAADWEVLRPAIQALDVRPLQVLIEVVIAEVRRTDDLDLGVTGQVTREGGTSIDAQLGGFSAGDFALELMRAGTTNITAIVSALARTGDVRIVSRPVILAQNNEEAVISVGSERPFVQVSRSLPTAAAVLDQVVQYRDVGTTLTITPTINSDGYVNLQLSQEVSVATSEVQFGAPVISTRYASTRLFVRDGQTIVIGGMIDQQETRTRSGIPLLMDIPLLGHLFSSSERRTFESELFIFLVPHIMSTDEDVDRLMDRIEDQTPLIGPLPVDRADTVPPGVRPDTTALPRQNRR